MGSLIEEFTCSMGTRDLATIFLIICFYNNQQIIRVNDLHVRVNFVMCVFKPFYNIPINNSGGLATTVQRFPVMVQ